MAHGDIHETKSDHADLAAVGVGVRVDQQIDRAHSQINRSDQLPKINTDKLEPLPLARFDGMELVTPTR
jgi:hypothetical protein